MNSASSVITDAPKDSPRPRPYIWVSWLTGLLAGVDKCTWKVWKKAHFRYAKIPGDGQFDLQEWTRQHDAMVQSRASKLRNQGYKVTVEESNAFKIEGKKATLAGKADVIAVKEEEKRALITDQKSGRASDAHKWQVLIYILAFSRLRLKGFIIDGEVEYRGASEYITAEQYTPEVEKKIFDLIMVVGGDDEPPRVPSASECRFCDIATCPDRWKDETEVTAVEEF